MSVRDEIAGLPDAGQPIGRQAERCSDAAICRSRMIQFQQIDRVADSGVSRSQGRSPTFAKPAAAVPGARGERPKPVNLEVVNRG